MPWNTAAESTNLTECSTTDFISPQSKTPHPQILIFSSFSNSKCFFFLNILPLYLEMIIVAYFTKSLEINQKFLNLQLPNVRAYIHRCSHSVVHMAECLPQKPASQQLLQKLLKFPHPLQPSVFTCSAGYQTLSLFLSLFIFSSLLWKRTAHHPPNCSTQLVTHLCISPSLLDPSRVYHLIHKARPEPSHLFHAHYCHARPSCP